MVPRGAAFDIWLIMVVLAATVLVGLCAVLLRNAPRNDEEEQDG